MKKAISMILTIFMLVFSLIGYAAEEISDHTEIVLQIGNPMMTVNGEQQEIDPGRETAPILQNDRTLLPVRAVIEELGGSVQWDGENQKVTLTLDENTIRLTIGSTTAYYNDEAYPLDVAPIMLHDRTMLPIRFVAEHFGFDVAWDGENMEVLIAKEAESVQQPAETLPEQPEQQQPITPQQPEQVEPSEAPAADTNILVVYFSATGNTERLAQTIAETANADICEIVPSDPYTSEDLNYNSDCRANAEQQDDSARPEIEPLTVNMDTYDTIILGYPIWWGTLPKVIYTFAETYDLSGKTILPFCTSGGSGIASSVSALEGLCPDSSVTDGFRGNANTSAEQAAAWLEQCGIQLPALEPTA